MEHLPNQAETERNALCILHAPLEVRGDTLFSVVTHLLNVSKTESRIRERIRARIAIRDILKRLRIAELNFTDLLPSE